MSNIITTTPSRARTDKQRGVRCTNLHVGWVECRECGCEWSPNTKPGSGMYRGWWRCPRGCNAHVRG